MKNGSKAHGFTIVEVMIVLAVTSALFVAASYLISGQQGKTQFAQAINDIQAQINDVISNVQSGYYATNGKVTCNGTGGVLSLSTGNSSQGSNGGCIFIGRAIQFAVADAAGNPDPTAYNIYDIVGLQYDASGNIIQNLASDQVKALAPPNNADTTQSQKLLYGLQAAKMYYNDTAHPISTVAFISTLGNGVDANNNLASGSQHVELRPVQNTADISSGGDKTAQTAVGAIKGANLGVVVSGGVTICFNSASSNQSGTIVIGANGKQLSTTLTINTGTCP